jgi:hypothetical protein
MTKQTTELRLTANLIANDKFIRAGEPVPFTNETLPEHLRAYIVTGELEAEEPDEPRGAYELNTPYRVTDDNRLGRRVQRQISEMEAATAEEAWIEEQMDAPLPAEIARDLDAEHGKHVARQAAELGASARVSDAISDGAAADAEPPVLLVRRGVRHYSRADTARLKPDEPVFIREPEGTFQFIGTTDSKAQLPDLPIIIT